MAKFCPNCGKEVNEKAYVCVNCGVKLPDTATKDDNRKSRVVAGILGIFFGSLGIHNFYLGYNGKGIAQLLMSVLSLGLLAAISAFWGLVEGIMILIGSINTDASGTPLKD